MEIFENNMSPWCSDEDIAMPYPMHCHHPMPSPMPYPPMDGMPGHIPNPMPCPHPMPSPMPYPPMNGMPGPMPMPIDDCDEETMHHMEQMYCMHMYMAAMNKAEAYKHKMMHCYCKQQMEYPKNY